MPMQRMGSGFIKKKSLYVSKSIRALEIRMFLNFPSNQLCIFTSFWDLKTIRSKALVEQLPSVRSVIRSQCIFWSFAFRISEESEVKRMKTMRPAQLPIIWLHQGMITTGNLQKKDRNGVKDSIGSPYFSNFG